MTWRVIELEVDAQQKVSADPVLLEASKEGLLPAHFVYPMPEDRYKILFYMPAKGSAKFSADLFAKLGEIDEDLSFHSHPASGSQTIRFDLPEHVPGTPEKERAAPEPPPEKSRTVVEDLFPIETDIPVPEQIPFSGKKTRKSYNSARNKRGKTVYEEVFEHYHGKGRFYIGDVGTYLSTLNIGGDKPYEASSASPALSRLCRGGMCVEDNLPGQRGWYRIDKDMVFDRNYTFASKKNEAA